MKGHDYILCLLCAKWNNNITSRKMNESRLEKIKQNLLSFLKLFHVILHMFM